MTPSILKKLSGGDLRSIGNANEVVRDIIREPSLFRDVFNGMTHEDPVIRMRSADVIEKVASKHPDYLQPYKEVLIESISKVDQQEVQWHVAQLLSYLELSKKDQKKAVDILENYIVLSDSNIVKVNSIQTLANFTDKNPNLKKQVVKLIKDLISKGSPSLINRGQKLLSHIGK